MKIEDIIKENSPLRKFDALVRKPFSLTNRGVYVLAKANQKRETLTHYHDDSIIGTTFFAYVAHQLDEQKLKFEADLFRQVIQPLQKHGSIPQENKVLREATRQTLISQLGKVKFNPNINRINKITGLEFWHFLWATEVAAKALKEREESGTVLHYMNNTLANIDILYEEATEFSLISDKNIWQKKLVRRDESKKLEGYY